MRKIIRTVWLTVAILICASCGPSFDDRVAELVAAKNVWISVAADKTYSYSLMYGERPPYTVSVSNPGTLREDWLEKPECARVGDCRVTPTITELFVFVLDLTDEHLQSGGELNVEYDDQKGYPKHIFFDNQRGSHSAFSINVSDVKFAEKLDPFDKVDLMGERLDGSCNYPILEKHKKDEDLMCRLDSLSSRCNKVDDCYVYCVGNDVGENIGGGCAHLCNYGNLKAWNPPRSIKQCPDFRRETQ